MAKTVDTVREKERELLSSKKSNFDKRSLENILYKQHKRMDYVAFAI